jgi:hypothetical protein
MAIDITRPGHCCWGSPRAPPIDRMFKQDRLRADGYGMRVTPFKRIALEGIRKESRQSLAAGGAELPIEMKRLELDASL